MCDGDTKMVAREIIIILITFMIMMLIRRTMRENLEDGFDGAPAGVSPHVNHHRESKLTHILAGKEKKG